MSRSRLSVLPIVWDHYETLNGESGGNSRVDWAVTVVLPAVAGVAVGYFNVKIQEVGNLIAGLSILTGLLFAVVIFVFQLRLQVASDPRIPKGSLVPNLLDELFRNVLYAVLAGLVATVVIVVAATTRVVTPDRVLQPPAAGWAALIVAATAHLIVVLLMCLKRLRAVYAKLTI